MNRKSQGKKLHGGHIVFQARGGGPLMHAFVTDLNEKLIYKKMCLLAAHLRSKVVPDGTARFHYYVIIGGEDKVADIDHCLPACPVPTDVRAFRASTTGKLPLLRPPLPRPRVTAAARRGRETLARPAGGKRQGTTGRHS